MDHTQFKKELFKQFATMDEAAISSFLTENAPHVLANTKIIQLMNSETLNSTNIDTLLGEIKAASKEQEKSTLKQWNTAFKSKDEAAMMDAFGHLGVSQKVTAFNKLNSVVVSVGFIDRCLGDVVKSIHQEVAEKARPARLEKILPTVLAHASFEKAQNFLLELPQDEVVWKQRELLTSTFKNTSKPLEDRKKSLLCLLHGTRFNGYYDEVLDSLTRDWSLLTTSDIKQYVEKSKDLVWDIDALCLFSRYSNKAAQVNRFLDALLEHVDSLELSGETYLKILTTPSLNAQTITTLKDKLIIADNDQKWVSLNDKSLCFALSDENFMKVFKNTLRANGTFNLEKDILSNSPITNLQKINLHWDTMKSMGFSAEFLEKIAHRSTHPLEYLINKFEHATAHRGSGAATLNEILQYSQTNPGTLKALPENVKEEMANHLFNVIENINNPHDFIEHILHTRKEKFPVPARTLSYLVHRAIGSNNESVFQYFVTNNMDAQSWKLVNPNTLVEFWHLLDDKTKDIAGKLSKLDSETFSSCSLTHKIALYQDKDSPITKNITDINQWIQAQNQMKANRPSVW